MPIALHLLDRVVELLVRSLRESRAPGKAGGTPQGPLPFVFGSSLQ
jgi:hypothetical protein